MSKHKQLLHIQLFGNFHLTLGDTPVAQVSSTRLQALLAYLVLHRETPLSRQHLAFTFYPDSNETQARSNLRRLLFDFRRALPDADARCDWQTATVQWRDDDSFTLDVRDFENALAAASAHVDSARKLAALERAVALYRGDLLPNCYDDWLAPVREKYRHAFLTALEELIELLESRRIYRRALDFAQMLLQHEPSHEATYRRMMRLYALQGDRASALRTFHACASALHHELGVEPDTETRQEYARLLKLETAPQALRVQAAMVGRHALWAQMHTVWRSAAAGNPQLLVLEGEAGIGKTRLAEELVEWAKRQGVSTAVARCYAAEGALAFAPLSTWLRAQPLPALADVWLGEIARLAPELVTTHPQLQPPPMTEEWQRQRFFEALARAFVHNAEPRLLLLDDIQWCDRDTLAWLRYLMRFDPHARLLVVATLRPEETNPDDALQLLFAALSSTRQVTRLPLPPLNARETIELAANMLGHALDEANARRLYAETEGNPLFVVETVRAGLAELPRAESNLPRIAPQVQATIIARLGQLSPGARELVNVAATIGREFSFAVLAQARGGDEDKLVRELDELWRRRIVREQGADAYDFTHDKLREVTYALLGTAARRMWHRRSAAALETVYASQPDLVSAEIARHYEQAGATAQAIGYYERAAQAASAVYAHQDAIVHLQRALALAPNARLYETLGSTLLMTGQADAAHDAFQQALTLAAPDARIMRARLMRQLVRFMSDLEAMAALDQAEATLGSAQWDAEWREEWIELQIERMWKLYSLGWVDELTALIARTRPFIEQYGSAAQRGRFFIRLAVMNYRRDRMMASDETLAYAYAALDACRESGSVSDIGFAWFGIGFARLWRGELEAAEREFLEVMAFAEKIGDVVLQARCLAYLTVLYRKRGDMARTLEYNARALSLAQSAQLQEYVGMAYGHAAWAALRQGKFSSAQEHAQAALEAFDLDSEPFVWTAVCPLIGVLLKRGRTAEAIPYARMLLRQQSQQLPVQVETALEQAIAAWERGEAEQARGLLERAAASGREGGFW